MRFGMGKVFWLICVAGLLASCAQPEPGLVAQGALADRPDYSFWPHEGSDIAPDPAVKYGVLANGMRFAIMRNVQPAGAVSLRFRIASGSLQETEQQRGLAHFLEHMAFNGSTNVPEGEFVKLLQRKGLAFGAHTNASTSSNETVYMLELPKNEADLIDTGLMLFREIGDRLTLDQKAIDREKGVVLSEQRSRNTPEYRAFEAQWRVWYEGQRLAERMPIGTTETIKGATRELIADYYRRFYRPERTLLVATGDFDVAEIEAKIRAKFSDWKGEGEPSRDPEMGLPKARELVVKSHVEANLPEEVSVIWFRPPTDLPDTAANRERNAKRELAISVINRRLGRIAREGKPAFVSAGVSWSESRGVSNTLSLSADARPGQWRAAMQAGEQELRRAVEHGVLEAEMAREIAEWRAGLTDSAATASTRTTSELAGGIVSGFESRHVFSHPADQLARFEKYASGLTAAAANEELRDIMQGYGPVAFVTSGQKIEGGEAAIASAYESSRKVAVAAPASQAAKVFPYTGFGKTGEVVERREVADMGVSLIGFKNGVKLNVKQTEYEKDTVYVSIRFGGGFLQLPASKVGMYWALPFSFTEGGLKRLTTDELEEALAGRIVSTDLDLDDDAFEFDGRTNQRDLLLQLQLMAAYATDPAYRGLGLERLQVAAESYIKQMSSSPGRVLSRETSSLLRSGDKRWAFPTLEQMKSITMRDVEAVVGPALRDAPIEISIVGDISAEAATAAVASTFGAFPAARGKLKVPAGARDVRFPKRGQSLKFVHDGQADQALGYVAWPGPDFYSDPRRARTLSLLREMLKVRLTDEFREAQGATYSPSAGSSFSSVYPDFGYIIASAETKPELVAGFYKTLDQVVEELKSGAYSDDLINRARAPIVKSIEKSRQTNGYWAGAINDAQSDPRALDAVRSQLSDLQSITKADLVAAAKIYLDVKRRIEIRVLPKAQALLRPERNSAKSSASLGIQLFGEVTAAAPLH